MEALILAACCLVMQQAFDPEATAIEAAEHARAMAERHVVFTPQTVSPGPWMTPSRGIPRED